MTYRMAANRPKKKPPRQHMPGRLVSPKPEQGITTFCRSEYTTVCGICLDSQARYLAVAGLLETDQILIDRLKLDVVQLAHILPWHRGLQRVATGVCAGAQRANELGLRPSLDHSQARPLGKYRACPACIVNVFSRASRLIHEPVVQAATFFPQPIGSMAVARPDDPARCGPRSHEPLLS